MHSLKRDTPPLKVQLDEFVADCGRSEHAQIGEQQRNVRGGRVIDERVVAGVVTRIYRLVLRGCGGEGVLILVRIEIIQFNAINMMLSIIQLHF